MFDDRSLLYALLQSLMIWEDPMWEVYAWRESSGKEEATEHGVAATTWWQWACPNDDCDWPNGQIA